VLPHCRPRRCRRSRPSRQCPGTSRPPLASFASWARSSADFDRPAVAVPGRRRRSRAASSGSTRAATTMPACWAETASPALPRRPRRHRQRTAAGPGEAAGCGWRGSRMIVETATDGAAAVEWGSSSLSPWSLWSRVKGTTARGGAIQSRRCGPQPKLIDASRASFRLPIPPSPRHPPSP
jgi:hypothetical protein